LYRAGHEAELGGIEGAQEMQAKRVSTDQLVLTR